MLTWVLVGLAWGGVRVADDTRCLDAEMIELDLRAVLGDAVIDDLQLGVTLTGGEAWRLTLDAADGRELVWHKELPVAPVDCPALSQIIVLSIERGLAEVPGFLRPEAAPPAELGFVLAATLPWAVRIAMGGDLWVPSRRAWALSSQVELVYQAVEDVGPGRAQVAGLGLGAGPGLGLPLGDHELRFATRIGSGASVAIGLGQDEVPLLAFPRLVSTTEVGFASASGIRVAARVEVNALRLRYGRSILGEDRQFPEPLVRFGIALSLAGPLTTAQGP